MEIHQVRYFLAVRDALNFTKAAGQCNVSQPALTRAIQKLEEELGGPLFHRDRSPTSLTELGRQVTPLLEQVWDGVTGAKERAKGIAEPAPIYLVDWRTDSGVPDEIPPPDGPPTQD